MDNINSYRFQGIIGTAAILCLVVFFYCYFQYSLNIPWFDDIENIPYFLANWIEAPSFKEKWDALLLPNNEHRVIYARLIVLIQYYLTGSINFQILGFIGNLSILIIFSLIGLNYYKQGGKWYHLLPVIFLVFNLQSYAGIYMTIMSLQYQVVIMLSMVTFYLLSSTRKYTFILAVIIAFIDTFSMGNGMLVWPAGLIMLLFLSEWRNSLIWFFSGGVAIFLYFYGFDFVQGNDRALDYLAQYPVRTFISFFTMIGGDFDIFSKLSFNRRIILPTLAGIFLVIVLLVWTISLLKNKSFFSGSISKRIFNLNYSNTIYLRSNAFWFATIAYVIGSILLVVLLRTRFDYQLVLWSTYKMYPAVLTSIVYLIVLQNVSKNKQKITFITSTVISVILCVFSYINFLPEIKLTQRVRMAFAFNQNTNGIGLGAEKDSEFEKMIQSTLHAAQKLGFYQLPTPLIHKDESTIDLKYAHSDLVPLHISELDNNSLRVEVGKEMNHEGDNYIIFQSDKNKYLFAVDKKSKQANSPLSTIKKGVYQIGLWNVQPDLTTVYTSEQNVTVE